MLTHHLVHKITLKASFCSRLVISIVPASTEDNSQKPNWMDWDGRGRRDGQNGLWLGTGGH